jgi:hypothetical protein
MQQNIEVDGCAIELQETITKLVIKNIDNIKNNSGKDIKQTLKHLVSNDTESFKEQYHDFPYGYTRFPLYSRQLCKNLKVDVQKLKQVSSDLYTFDFENHSSSYDVSYDFENKKAEGKKYMEKVKRLIDPNTPDPSRFLEIRMIDKDGHPCKGQYGLFAKDDIPKGTLFYPYAGLWVGKADHDAAASCEDGSSYHMNEYAWDHSMEVLCDGLFVRNLLAYANHPLIKKETTPDETKHFTVISDMKIANLPVILYYVDKYVNKGEEMFVSYGTTYFESQNKILNVYNDQCKRYKELLKKDAIAKREKQEMLSLFREMQITRKPDENIRTIKDKLLEKFSEIEKKNKDLETKTNLLENKTMLLEKKEKQVTLSNTQLIKANKKLGSKNEELRVETEKKNNLLLALNSSYSHVNYELRQRKRKEALEYREKTGAGTLRSTQMYKCVYGQVWSGGSCNVASIKKLQSHWDKPCAHRKSLLENYGLTQYEDETVYNDKPTPKKGRSCNHIYPILRCKYNRLHRWPRANNVSVEAHHSVCPSNPHRDQDMKQHHDKLLIEAQKPHGSVDATSKDKKENRVITDTERLIVSVLFINGANYYLQKRSTNTNATQDDHHEARETVKINQTDISIMIKFLKQLNLEEKQFSALDKEILILGHEKKFIENAEDLRLKQRVSSVSDIHHSVYA